MLVICQPDNLFSFSQSTLYANDSQESASPLSSECVSLYDIFRIKAFTFLLLSVEPKVMKTCYSPTNHSKEDSGGALSKICQIRPVSP